MKRNALWVIGIIVAVLALWWLYAHRVTPAGVTNTPPTTIADPSTLPGLQTGTAPWAPEIANLSARLAEDNLPELTIEGQVLHIHQHLDIFVNGQTVAVPPSIGINKVAGWISPIHVHDTTGVIHLESPVVENFTLGQFFDIWGVKFTSAAIGGYTANATSSLKVFVNGELYQGDPRLLVLAAHQEIAIVYGTEAQVPKTVPSTYAFPAGE